MPPPEAACAPSVPCVAASIAAWRRPLVRLALAWIALIAAFHDDWLAMARQWWDISTYNHILLIPLVLGWLVAQRVAELARLTPRGGWPGVVLFAASAFVWLLGSVSGLAVASQFGAVAMLAAVVVAILGVRVGAGLLFPLCYMALLVPFGDELVPALQMITAGLVIALVRLSGIPAFIDGVFIDTPAGLFEVAEACSGVKFLIAMVAFGLLAAHVCFKSWPRRILFVAFCLAVSVLANGVRAWATVFAAQYVGAEKATGFDHIVYGWVFFALVIAVVLAVAWRHFDRPGDDPMIDGAAIAASPGLGRLEGPVLRPALAMLIPALLAGGALLWASAADGLVARLPRQIFLPDVPGWRRVDYAPTVWWQPRASGAKHRLLGRYADAQGRQVDVFVALYAAQGEGREAGGFGEGAMPPGQGWAWLSPGPAIPSGMADRFLAEGKVTRLAETYYRTGTLLTGSNARLKLAGMRDRLLLRERPTMMLILSAEDRPRRPAERALADFRRAIGPLDGWMDRMARLR